MTRDEEIEQVAKDIARKFYNEENPNIAYRSVRQGILWADQHPKDNLDINFPKYDNIVDKVFGAGNLECWEYDQAKQLVKLAKDELLLELKAQQNNLVDIDKACEWIKKLMIASGNYDAYDIQENLKDFKKAMKGE